MCGSVRHCYNRFLFGGSIFNRHINRFTLARSTTHIKYTLQSEGMWCPGWFWGFPIHTYVSLERPHNNNNYWPSVVVAGGDAVRQLCKCDIIIFMFMSNKSSATCALTYICTYVWRWYSADTYEGTIDRKPSRWIQFQGHASIFLYSFLFLFIF